MGSPAPRASVTLYAIGKSAASTGYRPRTGRDTGRNAFPAFTASASALDVRVSVPPLSTQCLNIRGKLLRRAGDQLHLRDLEDPQLQAIEWLGSTAPADRYAIE